MTKILCLKCLGNGNGVAELNYRKKDGSDPAYYQCPKCGVIIHVDYGETESGERMRYLPLPKPDLEKEEDFPEDTRDTVLEQFVRKRFKN